MRKMLLGLLAALAFALPAVAQVGGGVFPPPVTLSGPTVRAALTPTTSAEWRAMTSDESGTGALLFANGALGTPTATSLALGGATIGSNALAVTGTSAFSAPLTATGAGLTAGTYAFDAQYAVAGQANIRVLNTSASAGNVVAGFRVENSNNYGQFFQTGTSYSTYKTIVAGDLGFYKSGAGTGDISILADRSDASIKFAAGAASTPHFTMTPTGTLLMGSAILALGAADVDTAPVGQTLRVQGALTGGTNNVAGANWTFAGSQGKGTGVGGHIVFRTAPAGGSGNTPNALVDALVISQAGYIGIGGATSSFPALARNSTELRVVLGDGSNFAPLQSTNITVTAAGGFLGSIAAASTIVAGGAVGANNATAIPAGGATTVAFKATSTANFGVFFGSGAPSLSAAKGSLYLRSDGGGVADRAYINTDGGTTWTAIATAG